MLQIKSILNPRNFTDFSAEAYKTACDIARHFGAKLIFLHVTEKPVVSYIERASELQPDELQRKLFETFRLARDFETGLNVEHRVVEGDPVEQILAMATKTKCDMIVMGTSGVTGLSRWFNTNVTEKIVRNATCPVLVTRPTDSKTEI